MKDQCTNSLEFSQLETNGFKNGNSIYNFNILVNVFWSNRKTFCSSR